jgi:HK97 family phage prohead protease
MKQNLLVRDKALPNLPKVQCRRMPIGAENLRFIQDDKTGAVKVSGYAVKWDSINFYGEKFIRGAFAEVCAAFAAGTKKSMHIITMAGVCIVDSLMALRIGKYTVLKEDDIGLYLELEFTSGLYWAQQVAAMVKHETVDGFSIAFYPPNPMDIEDKGTHVEIKRADIYEISVVDEPADSAARIINDDAIDSIKTEDDAEELIRSMGFPGDYAKKLMARLSGMQKPHEEPVSKKDHLAWLDD